jgi:hypothetical protein
MQARKVLRRRSSRFFSYTIGSQISVKFEVLGLDISILTSAVSSSGLSTSLVRLDNSVSPLSALSRLSGLIISRRDKT